MSLKHSRQLFQVLPCTFRGALAHRTSSYGCFARTSKIWSFPGPRSGKGQYIYDRHIHMQFGSMIELITRNFQVTLNHTRMFEYHSSASCRAETSNGDTDKNVSKLENVDEMFGDVTDVEFEKLPFDLDYDEYLDGQKESGEKREGKKARRKRRGKLEDSSAIKSTLSIDYTFSRPCMTIDEVVAHLKENNCLDLCAINVPDDQEILDSRVKYVDFFLVVSGRSTRHLKLMAFGLASKYKKLARERNIKATAVVEGELCTNWMVVDLGNIVVHFMLPETREEYELEKLWALGHQYDDQYQQMVQEMAHQPMSVDDLQLQFELEAQNLKEESSR